MATSRDAEEQRHHLRGAGRPGTLPLTLAWAVALIVGRGAWRLIALGMLAWVWAKRGTSLERFQALDRASLAGRPGTGAGPGAVEARDAIVSQAAREPGLH